MNEEKRYYYDSEACAFVEVESTWRQWLAYTGQIVGLAILLASGAIWAMDAQFVITPKEASLRVENRALERHLNDVNGQMTTLSARLDTLAKRDRALYRRLFDVAPISDDVRQVGIGGANPYKHYEKIDENTSSLLRESSRRLDKLERQMALQGASYRELMAEAEDREERLKQLPAIRPADGPLVSGYGMRHHPVLKVRKMHGGVDFLLRRGTPVVATGNGTVQRASQNSTYGTYVEVEHSEAGYATRYAHLSEVAEGLWRGKQVQRGDTLGYSGNSGRTTGPHLHYEVRTLGENETLDPVRFFVPDMTPESYQELRARTQHYDAQLAPAAGSLSTNPMAMSGGAR